MFETDNECGLFSLVVLFFVIICAQWCSFNDQENQIGYWRERVTDLEELEITNQKHLEKMENKKNKYQTELYFVRKEFVTLCDQLDECNSKIQELEDYKERQQSLRKNTILNEYEILKKKYEELCQKHGIDERIAPLSKKRNLFD